MNKSEILSLIEDGEGSLLEFKREEVHNDSLAKAIVAFSNTKGGNILIGVDDDGQVQGVSQKDWMLPLRSWKTES